MNEFDKLGDLDLPEIQFTDKYANIADGPFHIEYGGNVSLGGFLHATLFGVMFFRAGDMVKLYDGCTVEVDEGTSTITFQDPERGSHYVLSPVTEKDMSEFYPGLEFADLDEFKEYLIRLGSNIIFGAHEDLSDYALTVDDKDNVLGLFERAAKQTMTRREGGKWVPVSNSDEDWAEIDNMQWVPVLSGAVELFDEQEHDATSSVENFDHYIVG
jgi:hypothetical protein